MKAGELLPLTDKQKKGIEDHEKERSRLVKIIEEKYSKYPKQKRSK